MHALDLDDLQHEAVKLLRADDQLRTACRRSVEELLVDEYQDTNPIQQELLRLLLPNSRNLVAVGDEDQAIYGWRHAAGGDAGQFVDRFPDATIVKLEHTYRSTKHVLRAASSLIAHNPNRLRRRCTPRIRLETVHSSMPRQTIPTKRDGSRRSAVGSMRQGACRGRTSPCSTGSTRSRVPWKMG